MTETTEQRDPDLAPPTGLDGAANRALARLTGQPGATPRAGGTRLGRLALGIALVLFALIPFASFHVPWILPGSVDIVNSVGTLEVLALCFLFAALALGYDIMFGFTGLLSFGYTLYFAVGAYVFDIAMSQWNWAILPALAFTAAVGLVLAVVLGLLSLRVTGIAYAMVTLAFAQAVYYLIQDNPGNLTGGASGLVMSTTRVPGFLVGVQNTRNLYWLTLAFLVVVFAVSWLLTESVMGRVWLAIRENERRVEVLGLRPLSFKLVSVVVSSLIATAGGVVYMLVVGTASPDSLASSTVTVSLLVMVVLGGVGRRWGAVVGAIIYVYLQQDLLRISAQPSFTTLPGVLRVPLSQPDFLLGTIFILFILFAPGGIAGLVDRVRAGRAGGSERVDA